MKKFTIPLVLIFFFLSFFLGAKMIIHGDFFYLVDQSTDFVLVKDIAQTHKLTLIGTHSGIGGFFHGPLWLYILLPFYLVGSGNPLFLTYTYIFVVFLIVFCGFLIAKKLYNVPTALLFAFILALSPFIWSYMNIPIAGNMSPLFYIFLIYFLIRYFRGDAKSYIFAIFFAGLSLQIETASSLGLIPVVIVSFFFNKKAVRQIKIIIFSIISFLFSITTFILFDLRHHFLMMHSFLNVFISSQHEKGYLPFPERVVSHISSLRLAYESILIQSTVILETILIMIFLSFLYFFYKKKILLKKETKEFWYLLLFPVGVFVIYLDYSYTIYKEYLLGLVVPISLAFSIICIKLWKFTLGKVLVTLFICLTVFYVFITINAPYQQDGTAGSYLNQKNVAEWMLQDSKGKKVGYFVYTPETYTYGMDYLLWWESKLKGEIQPVNEKLPTTYLVLYPAPTGDQGAHAFWEKTKIKTASPVIEKKVFLGGIIVEKLAIKPGEPAVDPTYYQNMIFR